MVIIYVEKHKADETIWFKNPIKKSSRISLLSCSFTNGLYNLPSPGTITEKDGDLLKSFPKGNYDVSSLKSIIDKITDVSIKIKGDLAYLDTTKNLTLNPSLAKLLSIKTNVVGSKEDPQISITQPHNTILIHCDLVDFTQVMFNDDYRQLLSSIDVGNYGNKITHNTNVHTPIKNNDYINSLRLWVTDSKNNIITSGVYPMIIAMEII